MFEPPYSFALLSENNLFKTYRLQNDILYLRCAAPSRLESTSLMKIWKLSKLRRNIWLLLIIYLFIVYLATPSVAQNI
jgi:hypothetical protein